MDVRLNDTIDKVCRLSDKNPEFGRELWKRLSIAYSANSAYLNTSVSNDIKIIREVLEIRADCSITYDFVVDLHIKNQLVVDNLKMENIVLNLKIGAEERFHLFCVYAFFQVENIVNYYLGKLFPDIDKLLSFIEEKTQNDIDIRKDKSYAFKRDSNRKYEQISDIDMLFKLNAVSNELFDKSMKFFCINLRKVRNEYSHRPTHTDALTKMFGKYTIPSIMVLLMGVVKAIENSLIEKCKQG